MELHSKSDNKNVKLFLSERLGRMFDRKYLLNKDNRRMNY